jgi:hypothetical protein
LLIPHQQPNRKKWIERKSDKFFGLGKIFVTEDERPKNVCRSKHFKEQRRGETRLLRFQQRLSVAKRFRRIRWRNSEKINNLFQFLFLKNKKSKLIFNMFQWFINFIAFNFDKRFFTKSINFASKLKERSTLKTESLIQVYLKKCIVWPICVLKIQRENDNFEVRKKEKKTIVWNEAKFKVFLVFVKTEFSKWW